ncbi:RNA-directed DNA polymerase from mobile element jockey isoform X1 [Musca domestica]|uniref:RNA-directed DNA polymerase from mobile element jockey isoform X1 n=3 Tax=Musca domestica TaxID=7370 RepID=A0ABM3VP08_MUSDO|nr:RNA-directed DNA polymerase from mobile element jockey isoform X1 [Musca domestica]XP_058987529.1 RNA-directed DNA polymerase from mobile element jockey isoform X1 [Musca domestica]
MKILQYNIQSLSKNKNYLELYINNLSVDICILSEIFNVNEKNNNSFLRNYNLICKKRSDNYGGVAFLHKNNIFMKKISFNTDLDILVCETTNLCPNFTFVSVYFPHSVKSNHLKRELSKLFTLLEGKPNVFIAGDFNARCRDYGDIFDTVRGSTVKTLFDGSIFRCINDGSATFKKNLYDNSPGSVLDLTFTNSAYHFTWKVQNITIGGSHHKPILLDISNIKHKEKTFLAKKHLLNNICNLHIGTDMHTIQSELSHQVKNSTFAIGPKTKFNSWWNEDLKRLLRLKDAAEKKFESYKNTENALNAIEAKNNFRNAVKKAKALAQVSKINELNTISNSKSLFRYIKGCKSFFENQTHSKWCSDNNIVFLQHLKDQVPNNNQNIFNDEYLKKSDVFSFAELQKVLDMKKKPSAAGLDGITYEMVNNLSIQSKHHLLVAYNKLWRNCNYLDEWREIKIVPIPKKDKDLDIPTNFRPIALISVFAKIINLMVKQRLNLYMDDNKLLPHRSYAYRKHVSTSTCINDILHTINFHKERNEKVVILSMDVSKAYECVDISCLRMILQQLDIPEQIRTWILNFLCKRTLRMGNSLLNIYNGIPQGSCLSPTLFNLYTLGLHGISDGNTNLFQYADDFILLVHDFDFDLANRILQKKASNFVNLLMKLNLSVNIEKTAVMYVAKGGRKKPHVMINGNQVKVVTSIKFLGRHIKNSLSLKEHYDEVILSCKNTLNALKMVTGPKKGLHPAKAVNLSKSLIFSKTEYAISSMAHRPAYINKKLTSFQNQLLRRNLGLVPSTPNHVVCALAGILPTDLRAQQLAAKELLRLKIYNLSLYDYFTTNSSQKTSIGYVYNNFKNIFDKTRIGYNVKSSKIETKLNIFNFSKNDVASECIQSHFRKMFNELKSQGVSIWATDASVTNNNTGCAVCNISSSQNFLFKIEEKLSSLAGELRAIEKAIDIIIEDGISMAAIFTDSKNACLLLQDNSSNNYTTYNIIQKINNSSICKVTFIWVPSHVGISLNETADFYAKQATEAGCVIPYELSVTDAIQKIEANLWNDFVERFKETSLHKGSYFFRFFPNPPKQPWYKNSSMKPENIKIINRLFTGHTYTKKYFHRVGISNSSLCETCNVIEDENHIIFHCKKFNRERNEHNLFKTHNNLPDVLMAKDFQLIDDLLNFISKCKIVL